MRTGPEEDRAGNMWEQLRHRIELATGQAGIRRGPGQAAYLYRIVPEEEEGLSDLLIVQRSALIAELGPWERLMRRARLAADCAREQAKDMPAVAKVRFIAFKVSPVGILLLARWLPLQDIGSDLLVTFGKTSLPLLGYLCSSDGLVWDTQNFWWARLSVSFIVIPYVLLWILAGPVVVRAGLNQFGRGILPQCALCTAWILFGPFFVVALDVFMIMRFPMEQPRSAWLLNCMRLRVLLETTVESPSQTALQLRILWVKMFKWGEDVGFPWTLLLSICTSMLSLGLTLLDVHQTQTEQEISFLACLADMLCVGLGWRAPLLHLLKLQARVEYEGEGRITHDHCKQIARAARASSVLQHVAFTEGNELTASGIAALLATFCEPVKSVSSMTVGERVRFDEKKVCLDFIGYDARLESLDEFLEELRLPSTAESVHLTFGDNSEFTIRSLVTLLQRLPRAAQSVHLAAGPGCRLTASEARLDFERDDTLGDEFLEMLALHLPDAAQTVHLNFRANQKFTDRGLERLAERLPSAAQTVHLNFCVNWNFTDRGLERLAERLPSAAQTVHLNFGSNQKFTDRGLERLAERLPSAAQTVHLNFGSNRKFTARGLERLVERLPGALGDGDRGLQDHRGRHSVFLDFGYTSFSDRAGQRLKERMPPGFHFTLCCNGRRGSLLGPSVPHSNLHFIT